MYKSATSYCGPQVSVMNTDMYNEALQLAVLVDESVYIMYVYVVCSGVQYRVLQLHRQQALGRLHVQL